MATDDAAPIANLGRSSSHRTCLGCTQGSRVQSRLPPQQLLAGRVLMQGQRRYRHPCYKGEDHANYGCVDVPLAEEAL